MEDQTVFSYLCYYDSRNPYFDVPTDDWEQSELEARKGETCFCDNCFYGRHDLALEIIRLKLLS